MVVDIGKDCWNMILEMKYGLEHREKYEKVLIELKIQHKLKLKCPFDLLVVGGKGSGKSTMVINIMRGVDMFFQGVNSFM